MVLNSVQNHYSCNKVEVFTSHLQDTFSIYQTVLTIIGKFTAMAKKMLQA